MRPSRRQTQPFTRPWSAGRPTATSVLVALGVGAYASQALIEYMLGPREGVEMLRHWMALDGEGVSAGYYWKFLTYQFLHANPLHLLANMLLLYFAGREVEPIVGARNFLGIYLLGTLVGGAAHWAAMPEYPLVGASPGVAAVLMAFSTILPELEVTVSLFFVLPVRLRAKHLAFALVLTSAVLWATLATHTIAAIGPAAMLAGCAVGWLYVKQLGFGNPLAIQRYIFEKRQRAARMERMSPDQFISCEIDPILDKISRQGMHSLSRAERKILEKGREKIATRTTRK